MTTSRRTFLVSTVGAATLLAGCTAAPRRSTPARTPTAPAADRSEPGPAPGPNSGPTGGGYHQPGSGPMGPGSGPMGPGSGATPVQTDDAALAEWFSDVPNYVGVMNWTGFDEVSVRVGTGDGFRFGPAAIRVSPGTRVVWEWTGQGGSHNVVADDGGFESPYLTEAGAVFDHVFEEPGTYRYYCAPHLALGMKGAVVVADE